jgi:hypothetical protein
MYYYYYYYYYHHHHHRRRRHYYYDDDDVANVCNKAMMYNTVSLRVAGILVTA